MRVGNIFLIAMTTAVFMYFHFFELSPRVQSRAGGGSSSGGGGGGGGRGLTWGTGGGGAPPPLCTGPPLRLAIYQGKWWHTEVFGFIIDFARRCGHSIVIYHSGTHPTSALPMYRTLFAPLEVRETGQFEKEQTDYDAVFLTTPDDDLDENLRQREAMRYIYCAHMTHPKFLHRWHALRLYMTPLAGWPYVLQVYEAGVPQGSGTAAGAAGTAAGAAGTAAGAVSAKAVGAGAAAVSAGPSSSSSSTAAVVSADPIPASARAREVVMIGTVFDGENYDVKAIYEYATKIGAAKEDPLRFVAFTRHWKSGTAKPDNVDMIEGASTEAVFERVRRAAFVLIFPSDSSWYHSDRVTGAIPLAFSAGTPIVTTELLASLYGFGPSTGVLSGAGASGLADATVGATGAQYAALVAAAVAYRTRLVENNVAVIDQVLSAVPAVAQMRLDAGAPVRGGGGRGMLPLAEGFGSRVKPELGC
jgi:hypothetical protein